MEAYEYVDKFKRLIARERKAEEEFHKQEITNLPGKVRQQKGRALLSITRQEHKGEGASIFRFVNAQGGTLPFFEGNIGSQVLISQGKPLQESLQGTIMGHSKYYIDVYLPKQSKIIFSQQLRIDLFVNDATYEAQLQVLSEFSTWSFEQGHLRSIILGQKKPQLGKTPEITYLDTTLNDSQKLAVRNALTEQEFFLIQGPPGTGKTKTAIEIVRQLVKEGKRILVSADANMAVDNIMEGLLEEGIDAIRLGNSPKMLESIQEHTLEKVIESSIQYRIVRQGLEKIEHYRETQRKEIMPTKKNSAGLSFFQIKKLAERGQSDFGVKLKDLRSMSTWIDAQGHIKDIQSRIHKVKEKIIHEYVNNAAVICSTNTVSGGELLSRTTFDVVLIDEAGQSTEVSCLLPISRAKKIILVGDHMQLPPTVLSPDAQELSVSLFERMIPLCRYCLLDTQYRMHPLINEFPSNEFYNGLLQSDETTKKHLLSQTPFEQNVVFIECKGKDVRHKGGTSLYNQEEIDIVLELVHTYQEKGIQEESIGIISPYLEQVKRIQTQVENIEVRSVDGFQGRQKEIIIISLVRSNMKGEIGFLKDLRRLNVALTRAEKELVVIGNAETITSHPTYKKFLAHVKEKGTYIEHFSTHKM